MPRAKDRGRSADAASAGETGAAVLDRVFRAIQARRAAAPESSYVASLLAQGTAAIAKKVGEEATETVIAALGGDKQAVARESADLMFHLMVLWADAGLAPADVHAELARRGRRLGLGREARPARPIALSRRSRHGL